MTAFEKMKLRENALGNTTKNEMIYNSRYIIDSLLPNDPSYKENVEILGKGYVNLRINNYKLIQHNTPQMEVQASLSEKVTFGLGDVFSYDGGYWICIESNNRHDIERTGKVEECNYYLQWQNPKTLEIHGRWCSVRDPYSLAVDERAKLVITGNAKYRIKMPHDAETALFHADKRFLIDMANNEPISYAIIKYDAITNRYAARNEGFLVITLRESQIQEDDNWDLMIANYKDPGSLPNVPSVLNGSCTIKFNNAPTVKAGGGTKPFYAIFFDDNGEAVEISAPVNWDAVLPPELAGSVSIIYQAGNEIRFKADSNAVIGGNFILRMYADDPVYGAFEAELEITIGGIL